MRIQAEIDEVTLDGDYGEVDGVCATCKRCGHAVESYGTSEASVIRCLALLREECPNEESNYYVASEV